MRLIACAYRSWAVKAVTALENLFPEHEFRIVQSPDEFAKVILSTSLPDAILVIGWSWIFPREVVEQTWVVGIHPSDLPEFAGGSPIQNQILAGVTATKNTLFRISAALDRGPILAKVPLSLDGHLDEIFERLTVTSIVLLVEFIRAFPDNLKPLEQHEGAPPARRLKPESSALTRADFAQMTSRQLFDAIRCREDPYPNAYFEDEIGRLLFKRADFIRGN